MPSNYIHFCTVMLTAFWFEYVGIESDKNRIQNVVVYCKSKWTVYICLEAKVIAN
jgi:hypothetical protein